MFFSSSVAFYHKVLYGYFDSLWPIPHVEAKFATEDIVSQKTQTIISYSECADCIRSKKGVTWVEH